MIPLDVRMESGIIEEGLLAELAPEGDGVDKDVVLHPKMLVEADFLPLIGEEERSGTANTAVVVADRILAEGMRKARDRH